MRRIALVGSPGSGKTTVAAELARRLGLTHVELDAVFHQPSWGELPRDEFRSRVAAALDGHDGRDGWVVDGNYAAVQDLVWARADTVVWLDLPRAITMRRVVRRSAARVLLRRRLWNDNRERLRELLSRDPHRSIVVWAWTMHGTYAERYGAASCEPAYAHLTFVRLRSPSEVRRFLRTGPASRGAPPPPHAR